MTKETFQKAIAALIGGNKDHGWGQNDSLAIITLVVEDKASLKDGKLTDEAKEQLAFLVNPSACRQRLESAKLLNKQEAKAKTKKFFADFTA